MPSDDTINNDVSRYSDDNIDDAANALLKRWNIGEDGAPKKAPSANSQAAAATTTDKPEETVEQPEDGDDDVETTETEDDDQDEQAEKKPARAATDDDEVEVKVGEETHKVPVKDLKRLWGQEKALTQKSQEVAEVRTKAEAVAVKNGVALNKMLERATERFKPFKDIDWAVAQNNLSKEDFAQLRALSNQAEGDVKFFEAELGEATKDYQEKAQAQFQVDAKACIEALEHPDTGIKGWNQKVYGEVRQYAIDTGIPAQMVDSIVTPAAYRIIHKAMEFDRLQKVGSKKVVNAPKNVNKTTGQSGGEARQAAPRKAMETLRRTGSTEDAAEALMARWAS